jgi:hypothetical protein
MRESYRYEIAIRTADRDGWELVLSTHSTFTRDPIAIARGLVEQWIIANPDRLPGGRVFVCEGLRPAPRDCAAMVRVRVYRNSTRSDEPVAVAYIAYDEWDAA